MQSVDLSIVIPAWNEARVLEETIARITDAIQASQALVTGEANEAGDLTWEIIVCDNASTDDTAVVARQAGARVVVEPRRGIARARNAGARVAVGQWLLFIDADSYPTPDLVADVRMLLPDGRVVGCGATLATGGSAWWMRVFVVTLNLISRLTGWCAGAFLLCRHDAFLAVGGFNDDLYAIEEVDLVIRLRRYGRSRGQEFRILPRHPVITSARLKRGTTIGAWAAMTGSFLVACVLLLLHTVLPKRLRIREGWRLLGFWYSPRR